MPDGQDRPRRLAIMIDADNVSPRIVAPLVERLTAVGEASVRRLYGDFSGARLAGWSEIVTAFAFIPHQNFATATGKNAADIALVIDAVDLLHTARFDAFCIVSSDSDFTRLAARIREQGVDVYGCGERKTPASFRQSCKEFIFAEELVPAADAPAAKPIDQCVPPPPVTPGLPPSAAVVHVRTALRDLKDVDGWYGLSAVAQRLSQLVPGFSAKNYDCPKLSTLIERSAAFDVTRKDLTVYVRPKADHAS